VLVGTAIRTIDGFNEQKYHDIKFSGWWNPEGKSTFQLLLALLFPISGRKWIKNNLFLQGLIKTDELKYCLKIFPGIMTVERHFMLLLALSGSWCYLDKILYFRRTEVGNEIRKKAKDPIYKKLKKRFSNLRALNQMLTGIKHHQQVGLFKKTYAALIVLAYVFLIPLHGKYIKFSTSMENLVKSLLKNFLPEATISSLKKKLKKD
ncbi:MAG: hypothetical protein MI921_11060, partial [Cytophagales bacterium]|nr:hypothetical protein [Cytophagales bacterium]